MDKRRILMLFGAAWVSAALLTWWLYSATVAAKPEKRTSVFAAGRDLPLGTTLKKPDLKKVSVLEKDLPTGSIFAEESAMGRVALYPISKNEPLTNGKLSTIAGVEGIMATIPAGYRAVSVAITDVTGVSGLIQPGSRVDVLFTRPGSMAEATTSTILQNVKVLAVGRLTAANQVVDPKAAKMPVATLVITPEEAQKIELAKNEGKVSLSLRNPLDNANNMDGTPVTTEVLDPMQGARIARMRAARSGIPNVKDAAVWAQLTGDKVEGQQENSKRRRDAPAPPPRAVVDVYRGDKHVQEIFHD